MVKVKRSEVGTIATEPSEESDARVDVHENPSLPADHRDETIRLLKIFVGILSVISVGLVISLMIVLVSGIIPQAPSNPGAVNTQPVDPGPMFSTTYIPINPNVAAGTPIVEIHSDYQCPWCGRAEYIYGPAFYELSQAGEIDLRIQLRTLVGDAIIKNDDSQRAAMAAVCAYRVDAFWSYHQVIFGNQPPEGEGFSDEQLRVEFPMAAGIQSQQLVDFLACYDSKATEADVVAMEMQGREMGINGTPTFLVNGLKIPFDLQADADVPKQVTAATLLAGIKDLTGG